MEMEELANIFFSAHDSVLSRWDHINKYKKIRKLETEIVSKMAGYMLSEDYNLQKKLDDIFEYECKQTHRELILEFEISNNNDDLKILCELCLYRVHPKLKSIVDIFIENKRFRKEEKIKYLESEKNSFSGLFEIIKVDGNKGFVFIRDVFTGKEFKIIDIKLSTFKADQINDKYYYNRIITYDGISFWTGINCAIQKDNKELKEFLKEYKHKKCSDLLRCVILYDIFKKSKKNWVKL